VAFIRLGTVLQARRRGGHLDLSAVQSSVCLAVFSVVINAIGLCHFYPTAAGVAPSGLALVCRRTVRRAALERLRSSTTPCGREIRALTDGSRPARADSRMTRSVAGAGTTR
jgi:hypothetical protein